MQGNEPELVILPYDKFSAMEIPPVHQHPTHADLITSQNSQQEEELIDALNNEILGLKEEIRQKEAAEITLGGFFDWQIAH